MLYGCLAILRHITKLIGVETKKKNLTVNNVYESIIQSKQ